MTPVKTRLASPVRRQIAEEYLTPSKKLKTPT